MHQKSPITVKFGSTSGMSTRVRETRELAASGARGASRVLPVTAVITLTARHCASLFSDPQHPFLFQKRNNRCQTVTRLQVGKVHGRSPRMRLVSRAITSREAPTYGARSVLLITRKSDLVILGLPLRGIFSPFGDVDHVDRQIRQLRG